MPKKRTKSQQIGEIGENIFKRFALKNELLPNRVEYDYGIDFVCQTTNRGSGGIDTVGGAFVGVNVKSSQMNRIRAKLGKHDLESAFFCEFPMMFILVDTKNEVIYYKFLDLHLINEFYKILSSDSKFTLTPSILKKGTFDDQEFKIELTKNISQEYQDRIKLKRIQLNISGIIESCELKIINNSDGNIAIIKASKIEDLYKSDNHNYQLVRNLFLAQDFSNSSWLPPSTLNKGILDNIGPVASKIIMVAPVEGGDDVELFIRNNGKFITSCNFTIRKLHDETSFYHPSGLSLIFSERRQHEDNLYYHHFDVLFDENNKEPLFSNPDIVNFLSSCREEYRLFFRQESQQGVPIEHWPELIRLYQILRPLKNIYKELQIEPLSLALKDLQHDKFAMNFSLLQFLLDSSKKQKETLQGFVFTPEEIPLFWESAILNCPLLFSLPEGNILLFGRFEGKIAFDDEEKVNPVGMRFFSIIDFEIKEISQNDNAEFPTLSINGTMAVEYTETGPNIKKVSPIDLGISYTLIKDIKTDNKKPQQGYCAVDAKNRVAD